jgi:hypothetical protein
MRRALPFVLFTIAVITALWLSAHPDRGRPSAARELSETPPPVAAGPGKSDARQNAVWPPPSGIEAQQRVVPAAPQPDAVPVPEPTSANDAPELRADPQVVAVLEKALGKPSTEDPDRNGAPVFDEAAFRGDGEPSAAPVDDDAFFAAPQRDVFTVVLPPKREHKLVSSQREKQHREAPPLMPIAVAPAAAPAETPAPTPSPDPVQPPAPQPDGGLNGGSLVMLSDLPPPIQILEDIRIQNNVNQAEGWSGSGASSPQ